MTNDLKGNDTVFHWLRDHRRKAILQAPFPTEWRQIKDARHPERGHNVAYHEFAHLLDMSSGVANGTPVLHDREQYRVWVQVLSEEVLALRRKSARGRETFLAPYGALNEAEFFAVATEFFFDKPLQMQKKHRALYDVLAGFYRQDTVGRERRHGERR